MLSTYHILCLRKSLSKSAGDGLIESYHPLVEWLNQDTFLELSIIRRTIIDSYETVFVNSRLDYDLSINYKEEVKNISGRIFNIFSSLPIDNILYLPPIYSQGSLINILNSTINAMCNRELNLSAFDNSGHVILGGVEGAGKSTLLKAFSLLATVVFERVTPLILNYGKGEDNPHLQRPLDALYDFYNLMKDESLMINLSGLSLVDNSPSSPRPPKRHLKDIIAQLKTTHNCYPMLVVDEFQMIFYDTSDVVQGEAAKTVANDMVYLAKQPSTFCLIAGSSSQIRSLLFRSRPKAGDEFSDFPDFNASLYLIRFVPGLRSLAHLKKYVETRYPGWKLSGIQLQQLLCSTGGIGRAIDWAFQNGLSLLIRHGTPSRRGQLASPPDAFVLLLAQFASVFKAEIEQHRSEKTLPILSMSFAQACVILRSLSLDEKELYSLVDRGLIYMGKGLNDEPLTIELAYPIDIYEFYEDRQSILEFLCTLLRMCVTDSEVQAGNPMENLIRPMIPELMDPEEVSLSYTAAKLSINSQDLLCLDGERIITKQDLQNQFFAWFKDTGLDGIGFSFEDEEGTTCSLYGWQNKGGKYVNEITGGKLETSRAIYKKHQNLTHVDGSTMHGILVKAEVGFAKIVQALLKTLPSLKKVMIQKLYVTTSKDATKGLRMLSSMNDCYSIPAKLFGSYAKRVDRTNIPVKVFHGLQWLRRVIPSSYEHLFPANWNSLSIVDQQEMNSDVVLLVQQRECAAPSHCLIT